MIQLFLSKPISGDCMENDDSADRIISLLDKLESLIWSLILSTGGRSEARLWLYKAISEIGLITPRQQQELFCTLLRSKQIKHHLPAQLLQLIFQRRPHKAGSILAKNSYMLENFFKGNPRRVMQWFSHFTGGDGELKKGAKALSRFAFVNRDTCWEELEWKGKHGQSPAMVATKPHYFLDLDILQTVDNFVENVPEFWTSDEFSESLTNGEILSIDTEFFIEFFVDLMFKKESKEVWDITEEFLAEESFSFLCHHLLIVLQEQDLCIFLELIREYLNRGLDPKDFYKSSSWLEFLLLKCGDVSIDQLLLVNAVINQGRQLLLLLRDEEVEPTAEIKDIVMQICKMSSNANTLVPLSKEWCKSNIIKLIKWLGLHSWALHYLLREQCQTPESWESLFIDNGIRFRRSDKYAFLKHDGSFEEIGSNLDDRASVRVRHKKKGRSRKKQRRSFGHEDSYNDGLLDTEMSKDGLQCKAGSWFISIDEYLTSWNSVDLPEHLSKYCFSTWMKWLCDNE